LVQTIWLGGLGGCGAMPRVASHPSATAVMIGVL